jgi:hypothetical protein
MSHVDQFSIDRTLAGMIKDRGGNLFPASTANRLADRRSPAMPIHALAGDQHHH